MSLDWLLVLLIPAGILCHLLTRDLATIDLAFFGAVIVTCLLIAVGLTPILGLLPD